ncbi:UbiA prenyltransferase [Acidimicrobium ferrooxidans DSM 10331]|uniref:UbiA prenyltransferase n=1 Tax=Acidimicrobium ferrooxidans (strain DSM 10331 / JCM 15462 / NBRC 103882 / ICP) TaxID=525909 RepID=C7M0Z7_ACIFD|nr:decaprenyl-phosphate phosphoribosyltransferase [Acidimicrobium ferrooxidans]ACU54655.1 UbiA prenyltransferase [Acidimicrobium ferrooxidans DSM 10331]
MKATTAIERSHASGERSTGRIVRGLIVAMRPKQWAKNALVVAAPLAAGSILRTHVLVPTALAFVAFVAISAATYLLNDTADRERDAAHPTKRRRPIAAGIVPVWLALLTATILGLGALLLAALAINLATLAVLATYAASTLAYSLKLKHEPILDIAIVAGGFVLRAVAGGIAAHVFISHYFLLVAGFGALFVVASKRYAELTATDGESRTRSVLASYSPGFLNLTRALAATTTVVTYCFWAFERSAGLSDGRLVLGLSIVPFTIGVLRYALLVEHGHGEAPEDLLTADRTLLGIGMLWVALVGGAIFLV